MNYYRAITSLLGELASRIATSSNQLAIQFLDRATKVSGDIGYRFVDDGSHGGGVVCAVDETAPG